MGKHQRQRYVARSCYAVLRLLDYKACSGGMLRREHHKFTRERAVQIYDGCCALSCRQLWVLLCNRVRCLSRLCHSHYLYSVLLRSYLYHAAPFQRYYRYHTGRFHMSMFHLTLNFSDQICQWRFLEPHSTAATRQNFRSVHSTLTT